MAKAEQNPVPEPENEERLELEMVSETFPVKGGSLRHEDGCTLTPTGLLKFNAGGSESMDEVAVLNGLKPGQYGVTYGVDLKRGVVGVKAVDLQTANAMRRTRERALSIHLGSVFQKYPRLRPATTSDCLVAIRKDAKGVDCLMIALQMPMAKQASKRQNS